MSHRLNISFARGFCEQIFAIIINNRMSYSWLAGICWAQLKKINSTSPQEGLRRIAVSIYPPSLYIYRSYTFCAKGTVKGITNNFVNEKGLRWEQIFKYSKSTNMVLTFNIYQISWFMSNYIIKIILFCLPKYIKQGLSVGCHIECDCYCESLKIITGTNCWSYI